MWCRLGMCFVLANAHTPAMYRVVSGHLLCWGLETQMQSVAQRRRAGPPATHAAQAGLSGTAPGTGRSLLGAAADAAADSHERSGFAKGGTRNM